MVTAGGDRAAGVLQDMRAVVVMLARRRVIERPSLARTLSAVPSVRPLNVEVVPRDESFDVKRLAVRWLRSKRPGMLVVSLPWWSGDHFGRVCF